MSASKPSASRPFVAGDWVAVEGMHGAARVVTIDARRGRARVELRDRQWDVPVAKLTPTPPGEPERPTGSLVHVKGGAPVYYEIDLHGRYVEEALELAERGLDQAVVNHLDRFKIIHGHGRGRVRAAVRKMLDTHPHVESYRFGEPQEGGLACTVALLRQRRDASGR
jgi:DNA mismatch repair protein MutS2